MIFQLKSMSNINFVPIEISLMFIISNWNMLCCNSISKNICYAISLKYIFNFGYDMLLYQNKMNPFNNEWFFVALHEQFFNIKFCFHDFNFKKLLHSDFFCLIAFFLLPFMSKCNFNIYTQEHIYSYNNLILIFFMYQSFKSYFLILKVFILESSFQFSFSIMAHKRTFP